VRPAKQAQRKKKAAHVERPFHVFIFWLRLFDDFDDASGVGVNQNRLIVDDRVAVFPDAIFRRQVVVGHAFLRKHFADPDVSAVTVRRSVLFDHVTMETRPLISAQEAGYTTHHSTNGTTDYGAHWACGSVTLAGSPIHAANDALGRCGKRNDNGCGQKCRSNNLTDHLEPPV
jgi:hypothetical protein